MIIVIRANKKARRSELLVTFNIGKMSKKIFFGLFIEREETGKEGNEEKEKERKEEEGGKKEKEEGKEGKKNGRKDGREGGRKEAMKEGVFETFFAMFPGSVKVYPVIPSPWDILIFAYFDTFPGQTLPPASLWLLNPAAIRVSC